MPLILLVTQILSPQKPCWTKAMRNLGFSDFQRKEQVGNKMKTCRESITTVQHFTFVITVFRTTKCVSQHGMHTL